MQLDRKDFALISALQDDASKRLEDLARIVGMAPSSVHERLRRLKSAGVIRRWTIDCDESALGRPLPTPEQTTTSQSLGTNPGAASSTAPTGTTGNSGSRSGGGKL